MRIIRIGATVRVPKGRKGTVRGFAPIHTGRVGRPPVGVVVQERNRNGHWVPGTRTYRRTQLQRA